MTILEPYWSIWRCKNQAWGCPAKLALNQLERHRVNCNYRLATIFAVLLLVFVTFVLLVDGRLVACPAYNCKKKISYSGVTDRHPFDIYTLVNANNQKILAI